MCSLTIIKNSNEDNIRVAEIKKDYILNIIEACKQCAYIKKVVLFGSSIEERCKQDSDIDIAVFGDKSKAQMFKLKGDRSFVDKICSFGDLQDYDILYFENGKHSNDLI